MAHLWRDQLSASSHLSLFIDPRIYRCLEADRQTCCCPRSLQSPNTHLGKHTQATRDCRLHIHTQIRALTHYEAYTNKRVAACPYSQNGGSNTFHKRCVATFPPPTAGQKLTHAQKTKQKTVNTRSFKRRERQYKASKGHRNNGVYTAYDTPFSFYWVRGGVVQERSLGWHLNVRSCTVSP